MVQNIAVSQTVIAVSVTVTVVSTVLATYLYQKYKKDRLPTTWTPVGEVSKLLMYPLKSGRRNQILKAECTIRGLKEVEETGKAPRLIDRSFTIYRGDNLEGRNGRHYPKIVLIEVESQDPNYVVFNAPGMQAFFLNLSDIEPDKVVSIKQFDGEQILTRDCGDAAAAWISDYLSDKDLRLRLAYNDGFSLRPHVKEIFKDTIYAKRGLLSEYTGLHSDLAALHIINKKSVDEIIKLAGDSVNANCFRPNVVVDGINLEPFAEDNWKWIKIGDVVMKNIGDCVRCILTTVDMEKGIRRQDRQPLKILEKHRNLTTGPTQGPRMGIYLKIFQSGLISAGDTVYIGQ